MQLIADGVKVGRRSPLYGGESSTPKHSHRFGLAPGDPSLEAIEERLAAQPPIRVPTIVLHGASDGVSLPESSAGHRRFFTGPYQRRVVPVAGHFLPQEAPAAVIEALHELRPVP